MMKIVVSSEDVGVKVELNFLFYVMILCPPITPCQKLADTSMNELTSYFPYSQDILLSDSLRTLHAVESRPVVTSEQ